MLIAHLRMFLHSFSDLHYDYFLLISEEQLRADDNHAETCPFSNLKMSKLLLLREADQKNIFCLDFLVKRTGIVLVRYEIVVGECH